MGLSQRQGSGGFGPLHPRGKEEKMEFESRKSFGFFVFCLIGVTVGAFLVGADQRQQEDRLHGRERKMEERMDDLQLPRAEAPDCPQGKFWEKDPDDCKGEYNPQFPEHIYGIDEESAPATGSQRGATDIFRPVRSGHVAPHRKDWPGWKQTMVRYAHRLGGNDFVLTLTAENPEWGIWAVGKNNNGTTDHGLCQLNSAYHGGFIASPSFKYWNRQLEYCAKVWHNAKRRGKLRTTFYGYNHIGQFTNAYDWNPKKRKG